MRERFPLTEETKEPEIEKKEGDSDSLPITKEQLLAGELDIDSFLAEKFPGNKLWRKEFNLADGSTFNLGEIFIVAELKKLQARREFNGALEIFDPISGQYRIFSPRLLRRITGLVPSSVEGEHYRDFGRRSWDYVTKYLPQVAALGILNKEDFEITKRAQSVSQLIDRQRKEEMRKQPAMPFSEEGVLAGRVDVDSVVEEVKKMSGQFSWAREVELVDGKRYTLAELKVAKTLVEQKARRSADGVLMMDDQDGSRRRFSGVLLEKFTGKMQINFGVKSGATTYQNISTNARLYAQKYLPHLLDKDILRLEDFQVISLGKTAEVFAAHDRPLTSPHVTFGNQFGSFKYYIGRDKIVGTDIKIDPDNMFARQIDPQTVGIVRRSHGQEQILCYFPTLNSSEATLIQAEVREKLLAAGQQPDGSKIAARALVGGPEMKQRIKPYRVTDFFKPRLNESSQDYAERMSNLNDVKFITGKFRTMFTPAEVGVHNLPWQEQLVIANSILTEKNEKRLVGFARKYKLDGLRTFVSLDYGQEMGKKILEIGEKLPQEEAREIFSGYAQVIDGAKKLAANLDANLPVNLDLPEDVRRSFPQAIGEGIIRRMKDLLLSAHVIGVEKKEANLSIKNLLDALRGVEKSLSILSGMVSNDKQYTYIPVYQRPGEGERSGRNFKYKVQEKDGSDYALKIFIRPRQDRSNQARINFEINFDTSNPNQELRAAFAQVTNRPQERESSKRERRESVLRLGLDLDDFHGEPKMSLDMGRDDKTSEDKRYTRTGDPLGRLLKLVSDSGHHNFESFDDPRFADPENFAKLATQLADYLERQRETEMPLAA